MTQGFFVLRLRRFEDRRMTDGITFSEKERVPVRLRTTAPIHGRRGVRVARKIVSSTFVAEYRVVGRLPNLGSNPRDYGSTPYDPAKIE